MLVLFYFFFIYILEFFFEFFFIYFFLDIYIYLLDNPFLNKNDLKKINLNLFFFKDVEERKKRIGFTTFNDFYLSIDL